MITIVTIRPCPAETGGGMWGAGETHEVSLAFGKSLIGRGEAYDLSGAIKDVEDQDRVGGSSSAADVKLVTEEPSGGGVRIDTYTDDSGLIWDRTYNDAGDGSLQTESALGGTLLRTWSYTAGGLGYISSGAVRKSGGAYRVAVADMSSIKTELTALGAACEAPKFWVHDFNNGGANGGLELEWSKTNACFRGVNGGEIVFYHKTPLADLVAPGTPEVDAVTAVFPAWLRGPQGYFDLYFWCHMPGDLDTKTTRWRLNSSVVITQSNGATVNMIAQRGHLFAVSATHFQPFAGAATAASGWGQTNIADAIPAVITVAAGTDLTFTGTIDYTNATDGANTVKVFQAVCTYRHP